MKKIGKNFKCKLSIYYINVNLKTFDCLYIEKIKLISKCSQSSCDGLNAEQKYS